MTEEPIDPNRIAICNELSELGNLRTPSSRDDVECIGVWLDEDVASFDDPGIIESLTKALGEEGVDWHRVNKDGLEQRDPYEWELNALHAMSLEMSEQDTSRHFEPSLSKGEKRIRRKQRGY